MKKKILTACLVMLLVLASSVTALAETREGEKGWEVTFDGRKMHSNFSASKIDSQITNKKMESGDTIKFTVTLRNTFNGQADWYMKNQVLEALEDAGDLIGGAYDYLLTYTDKDNQSTILYSSDYFGGDGRYNGVGLHGATPSLDDYFYLDRMGDGDKGVINLTVKLEGESNGNNYQNTLARLQMDFATELTDGGTARRPVRTGDQSRILLFVILTLVSGLLILMTAVMRLRGERENAAAVGETRKRTVRRRQR